MRELAATARRLREVRHAYRDFLLLWAMERMASDPSAMERVARDVNSCRQTTADTQLADPHNHDWSLLYRGSILDD